MSKVVVFMSFDKNDLKRDIEKFKKENQNARVGTIIKNGNLFKVTILN